MNNTYYYIGNGAYCYANSASMLLASIGENIEPSLIEVLTGTSIGIAVELDKEKKSLSFDHSPTLLPDLGITKALDILGFTYQTKIFDKESEFPRAIEELQRDLVTSPAVIGPLVMGHLTYNPDHKHLMEADHFVLVYKADKDFIYIHDPHEFPHVFLNFEQLKKAWAADGIFYKKGYYRYTFAPKRIENPSNNEIYSKAISFFKDIYKEGELKTDKKNFEIGGEAIRNYAKYIAGRSLDDKERDHFVYFALPLGAKRALDYFKFFSPYNKKLADLKYQQSVNFGAAHVHATNRDWGLLSREFENIASAEGQFRDELIKA
ncbi:MAG: hypothetical protein V1819_01065 [bacterium]